MNAAGRKKIADLAENYRRVTGRDVTRFFCPVLFRDESVPLARAHIVNAAFPESSRVWTIQRKDVDQFFGSVFEADFVALKHYGNSDPFEAIADGQRERELKPAILLKGQPIQHYRPTGAIPDSHTPIEIARPDKPTIQLALKIEAAQVAASRDNDWEVVVHRDLRLSALVSLIKSAHLTLFELLRYEYGLSSGGRFVGYDILGKFCQATYGLPKTEALASASNHFREFINLVRPVVSASDLRGTITDRRMLVCTGTPKPWALIVFVKAGLQLHAVIVPLLEDAHSAARFHSFLNQSGGRFETQLVEFAGDHWNAFKGSRIFEWPAATLD